MLDSIIMKQTERNPPSLRPQKRRKLYANPEKKQGIYLIGLYNIKIRSYDSLTYLRVQFEDSKAEKAIKIMKLQQKISETFKTTHSEVASYRIKVYVSTIRKNGLLVMDFIIAVLKGEKLTILGIRARKCV